MSKLRFACFSDPHGKHARLKIEPCDILICAGDISMMGYQPEVEDFMDWFRVQPAEYKVFIAGNHDWSFQEKPAWWQVLITEVMVDKVVYLEDNYIKLNFPTWKEPITIYGSPWQPEFCDWAFNLPRGEKLKEKWALIPEDTDILITHGPPYNILDEIPPHMCRKGQDPHVGCEELDERILQLKSLKYHIFGHIHIDKETEIRPVLSAGTTYINASVLDNRYHLIRKKPYYFELDLP